MAKVARSTPHTCPVCNGKGELDSKVAKNNATPKYKAGNKNVYECHACLGSGLVWEFFEGEEPAPFAKEHKWLIPPDSILSWGNNG